MKNLKQEVDIVENKTFTSPEIQQYMPNSKWTLYSSLKNVQDLRIFMNGKTNLLILLDPPHTKIGHFVLLILKSNKQAIFFDPYGNSINKLLKLLNLPNYLIKLLQYYNVSQNINQYEVVAPKVQTCGRWCLVRSFHAEMSNIQFAQYMKFKNIKMDELVVLLTHCLLR